MLHIESYAILRDPQTVEYYFMLAMIFTYASIVTQIEVPVPSQDDL